MTMMTTTRGNLRLILAALLIVGLGLLLSAPVAAADENPAGATQAKTLYTCGMHPQVVQDHPGNCPICGMKLTKRPLKL